MNRANAVFKVTSLLFACANIRCSTIKVRDHTDDLSTEYPWLVWPQYTIDLDLPPRERWRHVIEAEKDILLRRLHSFRATIVCKPGKPGCTDEAKRRTDTIIDKAHNLPDDHVEELKGMVDAACRGETNLEICGGDDPLVQFRNLVAWNLAAVLIPSLKPFCTGIVATTPEGDMIQGRNLDYKDPPSPDGSPHHYDFGMLHITFTRGGQPLYTGLTMVGQVVTHTGMRLGSFSIQENTRMLEDTILGPDGIISDGKDSPSHNLEAMREGAKFYMSAIRTVLETAANYEDALTKVHALRTEKPHYIVLAGTGRNQGAVVSKPRNGEGTVCRIGEPCGLSDWAIVQSNEDPIRLFAGYGLLNELGQQNLNPDAMLRIMQTPPIFGPSAGGTKFTYIMRPARSEWILWDARNQFNGNITRWSLAKAHL